jgi:murein DD-endopeptidase MepM/ murein hydrolase activator NlpD
MSDKMKKIKYIYNPATLKYEKFIRPFRVKLLRTFALLCAIAVTAFLITWVVNKLFPPKADEKLAIENKQLKNKYEALHEELEGIKTTMTEIESRDNKVYRTIFEATPIPDSARQKNLDTKQATIINAKLSENELVEATKNNLQDVKNRLVAQQKSFTEIEERIANKEDFLAHLPAIQPVSNKELSRVASGYGIRIDPVYKTTKMHKGLDFTAPQGTPIYATANGTITKAEFSPTGFGNHIIINHGFGYETLYGHMVQMKAALGAVVKRGELIGWVGSTGKSTGPHCHYEVRKNGEAVNPVYYFYNDLSVEEFEKILKLVNTNNQSVD